MKLRFICAAHKQELRVNTDKALRFCQDGFDTGQYYNNHLQWKEAIPHLGCAFETADILLSHSSIDIEVCCEWLATSAQLLALNLSNLQYVSQAEGILWMAINRLEGQLAHHPSHKLWMDHYLVPLYAELKKYITKTEEIYRAEVTASNSIGLIH